MLDLDQVEAVINRPHVIELRDDGFTIMHPPACHPRLFACPVNSQDIEDTGLRGQFECELNFDGEFAVGEPISDAPGIDWAALVAELRAAREARETAVAAVSRWEQAYQEQAAKHEMERDNTQLLVNQLEDALRAAREVVEAADSVMNGRGVQSELRAALVAYDKVAGGAS